MKMKKRANAKRATKVRQRRRRTLTFLRMCRYGVSNFSRNIWLTTAATAVMSVTLLIVFMTLASRGVLLETVDTVSSQVDMSIYLKSDAPEEKILSLKERIEQVDNVKQVRYISAEDARNDQIQQSKQDAETLEAIREANPQWPATLRVNLEDINDTESLDQFISKDTLYGEIRDSTREPSFQGERRTAISRIGEWVKLAEIGGGIMTLVFVVISSLVVFNTIRMAIFNRKDEIQMMKLIGAEKSFIRGPFLIEAVMYGFIAAIVATAAGYGLLYAARQPLDQYGLPIGSTLDAMVMYSGVIVLGMIVAGALIGVISSYIATRKYLKL